MSMVFARAVFPIWVLVLGFGAFMAPAEIATAALLVALVLVCIPAVISLGVFKRNVL